MSLRATTSGAEANEKKQDAAVQNAAVPGDDAVPSWRIFVKTVGKGFDDSHVNDDGVENKNAEKITSIDGSLSFHVTVSPDDGIEFLHGQIEGITGVKASQQRLIYRGRLIGKSDVESTSHNSRNANNGNSVVNNSTVACKDKSGQNPLTPCQTEQQSNYKIKDIAGLCDGQTIHLVRKRDSERTQTDANGSNTSNERGTTTETDTNTSNSTRRDSESGGGGGALLAALLGLETRFSEDTGSSGTGPPSPERRIGMRSNDTTSNAQVGTSATSPSVSSPWRSSRTGNATNDTDTNIRSPRHNHRPHYRLGTEDLQVADPGSMEHVRQGLMTLNTIMNSQPNQQRSGGRGSDAGEGNSHDDHPLEVNREWFRGQWIDARDTVNQWLEATVVDILDPHDVLNDTEALRNSTSSAIYSARYGTPENPHQQPRQRRVPNVDNDPAISANDVEGRRRLLLEECEPGDPREITFDSNTESGHSSIQLPNSSQSFRPRASNNGVKLLLIHYNGWPHRWDEWIRSDSERLRPFRTRTRHPNTSSMACPTPQSIFNEAPRTNITEHGDEEEDRFAVLPELHIALSRVSDLLGELVKRDRGRRDLNQTKDEDELEDLHPPSVERSTRRSNTNYERANGELPWMARNSGIANSIEESSISSSPTRDLEEQDDTRDYISSPDVASSEEPESDGNLDVRTLYNQGELRNLATLFDRLGRTLTDAAPHIASIAASIPEHQHSISSASDEQNGLTATENPNSIDVDTSSAPLGGLLSLWSRERERARRDRMNQEAVTTRPTTSSAPVDPDHVDFASGIVNTTRGEVRSGPRSRASNQDDVASLLGSYLAAASLGSAVSSNDDNGSGATSSLARLLTRGSGGGSGDNGIDIHIHAIVTAPGVSPSGMGIATLSSGGSSPTAALGGARNVFSSNRSSIRADAGSLRTGTSLSSNVVEPADEEDYNDLFSELYSESPSPIDPNGSPVQRENDSNASFSADRTTGDDDNENHCSNSNLIDSNDQLESSGGTSAATPSSSRDRSSPRRQSTGRRSGVFRLFGRRRSNRPNNPEGSSNEDA